MAILVHWKKIVLGLALVVVVVVLVVLPFLLARLVTHAGTRPRDRQLTTSPADYGLEFEDVTFRSTDGIQLSGWYLGGADSNVAIACAHGLFRSRREVLDRAAFFRAAGYDTLVFDFRRHGKSEGEKVSLGFNERRDFLGAIRFLRERKPNAEIVLYGVSMGAAASLLAASESEDVAAVIADSSFSSLEHTVAHHLKLIFGLPSFPFGPILVFFLEIEGDMDASAFDLEKAVASIDCPVLIVAGEEDRRMPVEVQRRLYEASHNPRSMFRSFPGAGHGRAYQTDAEGYQSMLTEFLTSARLGATSRAPEEDADGGSTPASH